MAILKGKITSAKEHAGLVWLHTSAKKAGGWVALSKGLFDSVYKKVLIKQLYSKHNRLIERKIHLLRREIKLLKKEEGREHAIKDKEEQIRNLESQIKRDLHLHDLIGKKIRLKIV